MNGNHKNSKKRAREGEWWRSLPEVNIACTGCGVRVQDKNRLRSHPLLEVPICEGCYGTYHHGTFTIEEGQEVYCRWCGNGGDLVCCDSCPKSFCRDCIRRNFSGREEQRILRDADTWKCFCCDPAQVHDMMRYWAQTWGIPKSKLPPPKPHPRYAHTTAAQIEAAIAKSKGKKRRDLVQTPVDPRVIVDDDLSLGRERVPIVVVNEVDDELSPADAFTYVTRHVEGETMHLNTNPAYIVGCDCTDGCRDPTKCRCAAHMDGSFAYTDKGQLLEPRLVVYECNDLCSCHHEGCKNRVVGKGLQLRLEVFRCKEPGKGWGVRCLDRITAGTFVTDYLGEVLVEEDAEKRGIRKGDQYLFTLDTWATDAARWRMERLGIKDGSGFEADGTPPHAASPFPSPRRMRRQQQEEQGGEGQLPPLLSQLTQEELEDLKDVCERAPDIHSQDFKGMEPLSLSGVPGVGPAPTTATMAMAAAAASAPPSQEEEEEEEEEEEDGASDVMLASPSGSGKERKRDTKAATAASPPSAPKEQASPPEDTPGGGVLGGDEEGAPEELLASMRALEGQAAEAERVRRELAARWGVDLDARGPDAMRRQAEQLLDRTRDECERGGLGFSIDAQWYGNVARFLNHSCDPNLIKQTVFVESHDVRVPRVGFFALFDIPAREELTYDYGYTPGSVKGKSLPCLCGVKDCRRVMY